MLKSGKSICSNYFRPTLVFRKHFFLKYEIEEVDCVEDPVRLRLLTFQTLQDIKDERLWLTTNEYALAAALYIALSVTTNFKPI